MQVSRQVFSHRVPNPRMLALLLQIIVVSFLFEAHLSKVYAAVVPGLENNLNQNAADVNNMAIGPPAEKRRWQSLQGAWGKRNWNTDDISASPELPQGPHNSESAEADEVIFPDNWVPLLMANGERYDPQTKYSVVYVANANPQNNIRPPQMDEDTDLMAAVNKVLDVDSDTNVDEDSLMAAKNNKRSWKSMSVAWGKRRNAPAWNKFRGAWGKREPGWNNLKGMWGKRTAKDWQKLYTGWGKRSLN